MPDQDGDEPPVDFALAAFRVAGRWEVQELTQHHLVDVETLADALRRLPGEAGVLAIIAVELDFLLVRVVGDDTLLLLSDAAAAEQWDLADDALDFLGDDWAEPVDGDPDADLPPGDLDLLEDLGVSSDDLLDIITDDDDISLAELLSDLADQVGFGAQFDDVVGLTPA